MPRSTRFRRDETAVLPAGAYTYGFTSGGFAQAGSPSNAPVARGEFDLTLQFLSEVAVPEIAGVPGGLSIAPNPLRAGRTTLIRLGGGAGVSSLVITDVAGRLVRRLSSPNGRVVAWDGRDDRGVGAAPGVYVVRALESGAARRLVIIR